MFIRRLLPAVLVALSAAALRADDTVGVDGSDTRYPITIEHKIGDRDVKLTLTGAAMRKKLFFKVYTIAAYVAQGTDVRSAEALAAADCPKQMHLVMERDVSGKDMAEAFRAGIRLNYDAPRFDRELDTLIDAFKACDIKKGDHFWMTHIPKVGLHCNLVGKSQFLVKDVPFARAVWEIYLGKNNIDSSVKKALVDRLPGE
jgi:hypothetical protein